ncbi:HEPN domain-containing protein [Achromobacter insuavis]
MSYRNSRARREFETQLRGAVTELTPLYKQAKNGGGSRLLAAYYVFAFAQLEIYIKSFVEDTLSTLQQHKPSFDKWPDLLLGYMLHRGENLGADYRRYGISEDEGAILTKLAQTARKVVDWGGGGPLPAPLDSSVFLEKKKYPSPANLPQLFKRVGVPKIWDVVSRAGRMNSELTLTSLNDLRTGIAHEGRVPPNFGMSDFREKIQHMERFVAALDRGVAGHFCPAVINRTNWNIAMA